ncbi:MAG: YbhB/YbcL family Raf kinase inhibitor-like protein [Smithella sp.]
MIIKSSAFAEDGMIPSKYTCDEQDISPPLEWKDFPADTKSFALICDDPDAPGGIWVHWIVYNIPSNISQLEEDQKPDQGDSILQGSNSWSRTGYGGPCPPKGTHRYFFKLYALNEVLPLKPGMTKKELLQSMKGHILAEAQLMGKYRRQ